MKTRISLFTRFLLLIVPSLWAPNASAQQLIRDINQQIAGPAPRNLAIVENKVFFSHENNLWVSEGTETGTSIVAAIHAPEDASSSTLVVDLIGVNGKVVFKVFSDNQFDDLWVSDGTEAGTMPLTEYGQANIFGLVRLDDHIFFTVRIANQNEFWITNGTPAGTRRIVEEGIDAFPNVSGLTIFRDSLFFRTSGNSLPAQMWKIDAAGTSPEILNVDVPDDFGIVGAAGGLLYTRT